MLKGMQSVGMLVAAFPAALAADVEAVAAVMPHNRLPVTSSRSVGVLGGTVAVLDRVYNAEPDDDAVRGLSPRQLTILHCLYTRHHNGYVRQRHVERVVGSAEPWVIPFIIEIAGEYIPQILAIIRRGLPDLDVPGSAHNLAYGQFITRPTPSRQLLDVLLAVRCLLKLPGIPRVRSDGLPPSSCLERRPPLAPSHPTRWLVLAGGDEDEFEAWAVGGFSYFVDREACLG